MSGRTLLYDHDAAALIARLLGVPTHLVSLRHTRDSDVELCLDGDAHTALLALEHRGGAVHVELGLEPHVMISMDGSSVFDSLVIEGLYQEAALENCRVCGRERRQHGTIFEPEHARTGAALHHLYPGETCWGFRSSLTNNDAE